MFQQTLFISTMFRTYLVLGSIAGSLAGVVFGIKMGYNEANDFGRYLLPSMAAYGLVCAALGATAPVTVPLIVFFGKLL